MRIIRYFIGVMGRLTQELLCLAGWHRWQELEHWNGPCIIIGMLGVITLECVPQGIDFCTYCGAKQKYLINKNGGKDFPEPYNPKDMSCDSGKDGQGTFGS